MVSDNTIKNPKVAPVIHSYKACRTPRDNNNDSKLLKNNNKFAVLSEYDGDNAEEIILQRKRRRGSPEGKRGEREIKRKPDTSKDRIKKKPLYDVTGNVSKGQSTGCSERYKSILKDQSEDRRGNIRASISFSRNDTVFYFDERWKMTTNKLSLNSGWNYSSCVARTFRVSTGWISEMREIQEKIDNKNDVNEGYKSQEFQMSDFDSSAGDVMMSDGEAADDNPQSALREEIDKTSDGDAEDDILQRALREVDRLNKELTAVTEKLTIQTKKLEEAKGEIERHRQQDRRRSRNRHKSPISWGKHSRSPSRSREDITRKDDRRERKRSRDSRDSLVDEVNKNGRILPGTEVVVKDHAMESGNVRGVIPLAPRITPKSTVGVRVPNPKKIREIPIGSGASAAIQKSQELTTAAFHRGVFQNLSDQQKMEYFLNDFLPLMQDVAELIVQGWTGQITPKPQSCSLLKSPVEQKEDRPEHRS